MKKLLLLWMISTPLFAGHSSLYKVPELIQLEVQGDDHALTFGPEDLKLNKNQPYVMVIVNDKPFAVAFQYTGLGQAVRSQSLKGSNSVSTESIQLPPNSKVQWQFTPIEQGEFVISASNIAFAQKGPEGKVTIH